MTIGEATAGALLTIGLVSFLLTSLGLVFSRDVYDQIHFLAPGSIVGSSAFAVAVLLHEGLSQSGVKAIFVAILMLISNPILSHAIARAARIRRNQQISPKPD